MLLGVAHAQEPEEDGTRLEIPATRARLASTLDFSAGASQDPQQTKPPGADQSPDIDAPQPKTDALAPVNPNPNDTIGKQPKRILWIIPNYRAVSANTYLPRQGVKEKFWLATQETFDYSNFILVGMLSGQALGANSQPSFGDGWSGYGKYYWHSFADGALENYMVEAVAPSLTKEDPRYYTLGKGGFFKRTG
jgi:hypothetical protein